MATLRRSLTYKGIPVWRHVQIIQWTAQIVSGILVVVLVAWFFTNIATAVHDRGIGYSFTFLEREYQTPIGHHFLPYDPSNTFLHAFFVGFTNTLLVSVVGVALATALGIFIGVCRVSGNLIVSKVALAYIEFFRNVPLLVQLFFWFYIVLGLPVWRESHAIGDWAYLNKRYLAVAWPSASSFGAGLIWVLLVIGSVAVGMVVFRWLTARELRTGSTSYPLLSAASIVLFVAVVGWVLVSVAAGGVPFTISTPEIAEPFGSVSGGYVLPGALLALVAALVTYTASFIAEIVRAGLQSVNRGQRESARALGLSGLTALRYVTFPQALRVIIPPLISQYLNLTKNSSLAGAIAYSDLTNVAKTMTQTAPAISIFIMVMLAYLALSLTYSIIGNLYNRHIRF